MKKLLFVALLICMKRANAQSGVITTVAGNGFGSWSGDGAAATLAELYQPGGVAIDAMGNIYIADGLNSRIRMINSSGIISTIAGSPNSGWAGDGGQATNAELHYPIGVIVDAFGNLYIADQYNHSIRKVNTNGIISTFAGNTTGGYSGDGGQATAAELNYPTLAIPDAIGNIYIADQDNNRVRKIDTNGIISTIAGNGTQGYNGDGGQATAAELYEPDGLAFDALGNLYIADYGNNCVRIINTLGIISTMAGNGVGGYSGDGGQATAAELFNPAGVILDGSGNIYVAEYSNNRIRMINSNGIISTIVGNGAAGYSGDMGYATSAELNGPGEIAIDANGSIYIPEQNNNRVRKATAICTSPPSTLSIVGSSIVCAGTSITLHVSGASLYLWSTNTGSSMADSVIVNPTSNTTYAVTGVSGSCIAFDSIMITVIPSPNVSFTIQADTAPQIWDVYPTYTGGNLPYTYNWNWGDGTSSNIAYPSHTYSVIGTYSICVTITDGNGCNSTYCQNDSVYRLANSAMIQVNVINNSAGIEIFGEQHSTFQIYPNPSSGNINITSSSNIDEVKITDMLGQTVYEAKPNTISTTLTLNNVGVYFITITTGAETSIKKVIVNK